MTATVVPLHGTGLPLRQAVDGFLAVQDKPNTRRAYAAALDALLGELGDADAPMHTVSPGQLVAAFTALWGEAAPSTWNQRRAAVRSWLSYARRHGWPVGDLDLPVDSRKVSTDEDRAIPRKSLDRLFDASGVQLREKLLWRLLYDTAGRAEEILQADVGDLDMANRTIRVRRKGGNSDVVPYFTEVARLLPRYLRGRKSGPLFLADGAPVQSRAPAMPDLDPASGRGRLSYSRAARIFKDTTRRVLGQECTLHQLRHSRATHLTEDGVPAPMVMRLTGHRSARQFSRYARPSAEALQAALADLDPAARRRG